MSHFRLVLYENERYNSVNFEWRNPYSASKLTQAVRAGSIDMVRKLIRKGISLDSPDNRGWTPLHEASLSDNNLEICKLLISAGAFIDHKTVEGETALYIAAKNESVEIVRALLDAGCEVNTQTNECFTPLHIACSNRNETIIKLLIEAGANLNAKDDEERTPIYVALETVNTIALNTLIAAGADMKPKDFFSRTPLQYACMIGNLEIFDILIDLLGHDRSVIDQQTPEGWTLLMEAVQYKNYLIAKKLIEYGTDTTLVDNRSLLALHIAAHCERVNLIDLLLTHTPKEAIEKYSTLGANMTHYRSLPCLIIDKNVFDGLVLLFESGLSEDVLKCPAKMGDRLVSPISFLLLHANAVDDQEKVRFLEFLLSYDFLVDPEYSLEDYCDSDVKVVRPIEAAVTMHRPYHTSCYCDKYLSMILAKGVSPENSHKDGKYMKLFLFQKAIRFGFTQGIDLLLRYSDCIEPGDVLETLLKDVCESTYLWTGYELNVVQYLLDKCLPELSRAAKLLGDELAKHSNEWDRGRCNAIVPIFELVKNSISVTSLKKLCRTSVRRHLKQQCQALNTPFRQYIKNIRLPTTLLQYLLYEADF